MFSIALFGAGRIGKVHAVNAAQHPDISIKYIVDPYDEAARRLAQQVGATVSDTATVMNDAAVAGVVIGSSTDTHADLLIRAADSGKVIFCEKPISLDIQTVKNCVDYINAKKAKCMLGFQRRYDRSFRHVRKRIDSGEVGPIEQVLIVNRDPAPPPIEYLKVSGGQFRDMAIHDFDIARYIVQEDIATVYATGTCRVDPAIGAIGDVDTITVTMVTTGGRTVQIAGTRRGPMGYEQRLEVVCAKAVLKVENLPQHTATEADLNGLTSPPPEGFFLERYAQAYREEMDMFAQMMGSGAIPLADHDDGYQAQRLAEAAVRSWTKGEVVKLI